MGEKWNAPHPFPFFCDFDPDLAEAVREGRRREFAKFPEFADPAARARIPDPLAVATFVSAKLDWSKIVEPEHAEWLAFYRALLAIRRREIVPRLAQLDATDARWQQHGGAIEVRWTLNDGAELRAILALNAGPTESIAIMTRGRPIFATAPDAAAARPIRALPPWFAAFFLNGPERRP